MQERTISVKGAHIHTESFGDAANPCMLLIMGAMASALWWPAEFCMQLAGRGLFVLRYDHRDTGRSTKYPLGEPGYTAEDLADDAYAVLEAYGVAAAHIAGMSLGGFLAQLIALKYPSRVLSLTLIATEPLGPGNPDIPGIDERVLQHHMLGAELDWSDREQVVEFSTGGWRLLNGSAHPFDDAGVRSMAREDYDRGGGSQSFMNHAFLSGGERWYNRLHELDVRALVIHGTEDPVLRYANALALMDQLQFATLLTLEGSGHELHPADWPAMIEAIIRHTLW